MNIKQLILGLALIVISCKPQGKFTDGQSVTLSGKIRLIGNTPFTSLVLSPNDTYDLYIVFQNPETQKKVEEKIGTWQTLSGRIKVQRRQTADQKITQERYQLILDK